MSQPLKKNDHDPSHQQAAKNKQPVWMVVATTNGEAEGAIIAGRLQSLGIPAFLHRESIGSVLGLTLGLGRVDVVVPEDAYPAAMVILNPDPDTPWIDDGEGDSQPWEEEPDEGDA